MKLKKRLSSVWKWWKRNLSDLPIYTVSRRMSNCPIHIFKTDLRNMQAEVDLENGIVGSTIQKTKGDSFCVYLSNLAYTDWLLIRIWFHKRRGGCEKCK